KLFMAVRAGVPVVASDLPALRRLVTEHGIGRLYRPGDPASLAAAVREVQASYGELTAAVARARAELAWERDAEALRGVYAWRAERFFVLAAPSGAMRKLRSTVTKLGGIRGLGRPARKIAGVVIALHAFQYRASRGLHHRWMAGPYRVLRPLWLWRLLRRSAL